MDDPEYGPESALLQDIYARLDDMDPQTFEMRAARLLHGLGFAPVTRSSIHQFVHHSYVHVHRK